MKVLYFAWVRQKTGVSEETLSPPPDVTTVRELAAWLAGRSPGHAEALGDLSRLRVAVNQVHTGFDAPLAGAEEVAFFPPVTGG